MTANLSTGLPASIIAAMEAARIPATLVSLACGDHSLLRGVHKVGDEAPCAYHQAPSVIVDTLDTFILKDI